MNKKNVAAKIGIVAAIALLTTSCAGNGGDGGGDVTIRFANAYNPSHPVNDCGVPAMQESLEGTGLRLDNFPSAQLGSETEMIDQVASGSVEMAETGPAFLSSYYPEALVLDIPYLFRDVDQFEEVMDGPIAQGIWDGLRDATGVHVLTTWYYGTRQLTANKEVTTSADMQGVTLRAPSSPIGQTMAEIMGAAGTPMTLDEVYLALQQGVIDAQENPIPTIASQRFYEVQDYLNLTGHAIQGIQIVTSDSFLSSLTEEQQTALQNAVLAAKDAVRECTEQQEADFIKEWSDNGDIIVNDAVDRDSFRERAAQIVPKNFPELADLYLQIQGS